MSQPQPIVSISFTLADGTSVVFSLDEMEPSAHYSVSRNFNKPSRKSTKSKTKEVSETWLEHDIHFVTNRETEDGWKKRISADAF